MKIPDSIYREAFWNAPIGLAMSDGRGYVVDANDYLLGLGGWEREELKGMMATDFYVDGAKVRHDVLDAMRNLGKLEDHEVRFRRKDGSTFMSSMSVRPIVIDGEHYVIAAIRALE